MLLRVAVAFLFLAVATGAHAERRVGLVIGMSAYKNATPLQNPKHDAMAIAKALKKHDFEVIEGYDLNKADLEQKIRDFARALSGSSAGVLFYAGHGLQVAGVNYLIPVDVMLEDESALDFEMVPLDLILRVMERSARTNLIFLDACRSNPFARSLARKLGTRSSTIGTGLAAVEGGAGTLISFSTQPGNVATDGSGSNSPFAGALAKRISQSSASLSDMLVAVRNDVMKQTNGKQIPWEHSALTKAFFFNEPARTAVIESLKHWPDKTIPTGKTVTTTTGDGRKLTCVGGDQLGAARKCKWD